MAVDEQGVPDFPLLQEAISESRSGSRGSGGTRGRDGRGGHPGRLLYQAFDLLYLDGRSLLRVPLEDRKRLLRSVLRESPRVRYASHVEGDGRAFYQAASQRGLEGVVAKLRRSTYEPGRRTPAWLKIKIRPEQELVVGGWTPGEGNARDLGALAVGVYEGDALRFAGKVGSGFTGKWRTELRRRLAPLETDRAPFDPAPERKGELRLVTWVQPELVIRAEIGGWTRDGIVRQTAFKGIDEGHDPLAVTREQAVSSEEAAAQAEELMPESTKSTNKRRAKTAPAPAEPATFAGATEAELEALAALPNEALWQVGGRELKVTNLDKPLFAPLEGSGEEPITKRELIAYFGRIAPQMLTHLAERPLNLQRFPNGAGSPGFWQKDIPSSAPDWLRRWKEVGVDDRDANTHLVADEVAELCWLGNQASFEVHAWTGKLPRPDRPTFALVDIDPGEKTTWDETLEIARLYRAAFEHLGLRAYPKVTGKRGIQAWLPIVPKYEFHDTSAWVEKLSRAIGAMVPNLVSWEWAKAARKGRARLDYTQNTFIKTLVAPYSVRPAPGAPVSAPITWDELDDPGLRSNSFTIRNLVERVAERGDLFAGAQTDLQELPKLG